MSAEPSSKRPRKTDAEPGTAVCSTACDEGPSSSPYDAYFEALRQLQRAEMALATEGRSYLPVIGEENLNSVMEFLDVEEVVQCEMASRTVFAAAAARYWQSSDRETWLGYRSCAADARTREIRFHLAWIEAACVVEDVFHHCGMPGMEGDHYLCEGVGSCCTTWFPERLDQDVFKNPNEYELFLYVTRREEKKQIVSVEYAYDPVLYGFTSFAVLERGKGMIIDLSNLNLREDWPAISKVATLSGEDGAREAKRIICEEMAELFVTIVSLRKSDFKTNLVAASFYLGKETASAFHLAHLPATPSSFFRKPVHHIRITPHAHEWRRKGCKSTDFHSRFVEEPTTPPSDRKMEISFCWDPRSSDEGDPVFTLNIRDASDIPHPYSSIGESDYT